MSASTVSSTEQTALPHLETTQVQIKSILAATDLSEPATTALKIAAHIAKLFHSRLHVVYAVMPDIFMTDTTMLTSELRKIQTERAQQQLHEYMRGIPEVRTMLHEEVAISGVPPDAIAGFVLKSAIDLVVMGSHGRGPTAKMVLGSIAESVIRHIHCPVLVAGPHCDPEFHPLRSIVLATDLPPTSLRAAQYATSLAGQFGSSLTVAHVLKDHGVASGPIEENLIRKELRELVPHDVELKKHLHIQINSGTAAEEIAHIAKRKKADLIVMGAHEDGTLADHAPWATLSHVIREARCPVLVVQPHST